MENASKALIIAGAVLIALMVISLGVMVFNRMSSSVESNTDMTQEEISAFNNKLIPYLGQNIAGSKVNQLIQVAFSINQNAAGNDVTVAVNKSDGTELVKGKAGSNTSPKKVESNSYYTVTATYNETTGLIYIITIT